MLSQGRSLWICVFVHGDTNILWGASPVMAVMSPVEGA